MFECNVWTIWSHYEWRLYSLIHDTELLNCLLPWNRKSSVLNLFYSFANMSYLNIRHISLKYMLNQFYVSFQYDRMFLQARVKGICYLHWCLLMCELCLILSSLERASKKHRSKFKRSLMEIQTWLTMWE